MYIFIRHGEKSKNDNIHLSRVGYVRRNELPHFFKNQKNKHINIPEKIIAMKQHNIDSSNRPFETVSMLSHDLNIPIEHNYTQTQIDDIVDHLLDKNTTHLDTLICWEHEELTVIVKKLIQKIYNNKFKLYWGRIPILNTHSDNDYTSIWVVDTIKHYLYVYNEFDIIYNEKLDCYDIDYSTLQNRPFFSLKLNKSSWYDYLINLF